MPVRGRATSPRPPNRCTRCSAFPSTLKTSWTMSRRGARPKTAAETRLMVDAVEWPRALRWSQAAKQPMAITRKPACSMSRSPARCHGGRRMAPLGSGDGGRAADIGPEGSAGLNVAFPLVISSSIHYHLRRLRIQMRHVQCAVHDGGINLIHVETVEHVALVDVAVVPVAAPDSSLAGRRIRPHQLLGLHRIGQIHDRGARLIAPVHQKPAAGDRE